jgi:endonuclease/exonuclease/phosphatase family metal-dependent hydrolase
MKKSSAAVIAFGIFFLFFIQMAGTLIQSIYVLDLMHTSLDAKAMGVFFFFAPALLLIFRRRIPQWMPWIAAGVLFITRAATPWLSTNGRLFTAGMAMGSALMLMPFLFRARIKGKTTAQTGEEAAAGLALAAAVSVLLRTINFSVDYSLTPDGAWSGWILGLVFAWALTRLEWKFEPAPRNKTKGAAAPLLGIFMAVTLVYFAFSAPAVISRWTGGSYPLITSAVSLFSLGWIVLSMGFPGIMEKITRSRLWLWNLLFGLSLVGTLLLQRVTFPNTLDAQLAVRGGTTGIQRVVLFLMLVLFPVIFADLRLFIGRIKKMEKEPVDLIPGILLGSLALVVLIFITIFTNVWGYIKPVSTPFRNMFWLPFFLISGTLLFLSLGRQAEKNEETKPEGNSLSWQWWGLVTAIFITTLLAGLVSVNVHPGNQDKTELLIMTYNIQAGNDSEAERSFDRQLDLIRRLNPDIVGLQESDTARIALNNDDYVRYFAGKLGYYSYYGPKTVAGSFGTAILSRYPLFNARTVFTYSDTDENGTAEAEIAVGGRLITIHDVHPDGSKAAKLAFAKMLVERAQGDENFLALGDFNLRQDAEAYQVVASKYADAWYNLHPEDTENRWIDHIFVSEGMEVKDATYLLPPDSATDHPVLWAHVFWNK